MTLIEFNTHYPTERSCREALRAMRESSGIICKKCNHVDHTWSPSIEKWQCKSCGYQSSLKSGTVMAHSNLPIRKWFLCIHLMSSTNKGFSAKEIQRQLGHKRYEPIWRMMHKIRQAMGSRDAQYQLKGQIELDDAYFKQVVLDKQERAAIEQEGLKRGKGSQKQAKVMALIGSQKVDDPKKHQKSRKCNYLRMKVMPDFKAETVNESVSQIVESHSQLVTDEAKSFYKLEQVVDLHQAYNLSQDKEQIKKVLPWVHTAISNAKKKLNGIYHMIGDRYMQNYLDEFCYNFNRRYFQGAMFKRLMIACIELGQVKKINFVNGG